MNLSRRSFTRGLILLSFVFALVFSGPAPAARAASIIRVKPLGLTTWPCGSTWAAACAELQTAVTNAASGDEIWVAAGVHKPVYGTTRTATFQLKSNMSIYGGFAGTETLRTQRNPATHVTILSGDIDSNDVNTDGNEIAETTADISGTNAYHVVTGAAGVTLDGLTITAGDADSGSNCPSNGCGGGLYNYANSSTVMDVIFSGNYAAYVGGGMANVSMGFDFPSNAVLSKVTFVGNGSGSTGGGLYNYLNTATLTNVTFKSNSAPYGGAMHNYSYTSVTVTNVTFRSNWSYDGRALYNTNVSSVTVWNSILWNDGALEIENDSTSHVTVSNSVMSGGCTTGFAANVDCTNLITTDPVLGTLANYGGNVPTLPLLPGSSAPSATSTNCPATDARGIARGTTCDLGAFESRGFVLTKTSGDNQISPINTAFAQPLGLTITATG
ncbi:MAG: hypothetical protein KA765_15595, partial [Thermoflexales bacterium]|nr:hypothetical protein [Thermoflexales bacterium]